MADSKPRAVSQDDRSVTDGVAASFASLKTGLDGLILQTVLTASAPGSAGGQSGLSGGDGKGREERALILSTASKEPLSLQTTSNNFRK